MPRLDPEPFRHPIQLGVAAVDEDRRLVEPRQVVQEGLVVDPGAPAELDDEHGPSARVTSDE